MKPRVWPLSESAEHQLVLVQELHSIVGDWELTPEDELQKFWKQLLVKLATCVGKDAHFDLASAAMKLLLGTRLLGLLEEAPEVQYKSTSEWV
jgi:hypothetical protein